MKNKGFTLIELLGVIVLLSLITLIVLPKITSAVKSKQSDVDSINKKLIYSAVELYLKDNYDLDNVESGSKFCIEISTLVEKGYLKETKDIYTDELLDDKVVLVEYSNGLSYIIFDSLDECNSNIE